MSSGCHGTEGPSSTLAHTVAGDQRLLLFVHQLAPEADEITLRLPREHAGGCLIDLVDGLPGESVGSDGRVSMVLGPYAHHWLAIELDGKRRAP